MIFNTETAFNIPKKDVKFLDAGIHENVSLERVRHDKSPNGNLFLEFTFSKDGARTTHTEYEPTKLPDQTDEDFNLKVNKQVARILHIMEAFYDRSQLSFSADNFTSFASWVSTLMNNIDNDKKVRIKAVYGNNGYISLPKYSTYTFIESMEIKPENSKIKRLGIDNFERPEVGDQEPDTPTAESVFNSINTNTVDPASGMPF